MKRISNKIATIIIAVIVFGLLSFTQSDKDYNFESAKNLDIFHSLYRELYLNYVDQIDPEKLIKTAIDKMLESLDPYTVYIPENQIEDIKLMTTGQYGGCGALIRQTEDYVMITDPYENSPATKAGILAGDKILEIDGHSMKGKTSAEVSELLRGEPNTKVNIKVQHMFEEKPTDVTVTREEIKLDAVSHYEIIDNNIGYISLSSFTNTAASEVQDALLKMKKNNVSSLILDLRSNPGGLLMEAVKICNFFISEGEEIVSTKGKTSQQDKSYKATAVPIDKDMKIVVLVDEMSASASEIVSGCMQDLDRGIILGHRTFGKGLVQTTRNLSYNGILKVTTAKYYTPSGRCIQALDYSHRNEDGSVGHVPDSLISKFYTKNKREVYDGGGITPDVTIKDSAFSTITTKLVLDDLFFKYSVYYRSKHEKLNGDIKSFKFTDEDYNDFKNFLSNEKFEYKSFTEEGLKDLIELAKQEKYYDNISADIEKLSEKLKKDKNNDLDRYKDEIIECITSSIMSRYYFEKGSVMFNISHDQEIKKAVEILKDDKQYKEILKQK